MTCWHHCFSYRKSGEKSGEICDNRLAAVTVLDNFKGLWKSKLLWEDGLNGCSLIGRINPVARYDEGSAMQIRPGKSCYKVATGLNLYLPHHFTDLSVRRRQTTNSSPLTAIFVWQGEFLLPPLQERSCEPGRDNSPSHRDMHKVHRSWEFSERAECKPIVTWRWNRFVRKSASDVGSRHSFLQRYWAANLSRMSWYKALTL